MSYVVNIEVEVQNEDAMRQAARDRAFVEGMSAIDADSYLNSDDMSVGACLCMLLDPGKSPPGCTILESHHGIT